VTSPSPAGQRARDAVTAWLAGDHRRVRVLIDTAENLPAVAAALVELAGTRAAQDAAAETGAAQAEQDAEQAAAAAGDGSWMPLAGHRLPGDDTRRSALAAVAAWLDQDGEAIGGLLRHEPDPESLVIALAGMAGRTLADLCTRIMASSADPEVIADLGLADPALMRAAVAEYLRGQLQQSPD
jgi:hypothetical protein